MRCPKCGTQNPEKRKFCRECGAKLARVCPRCGSENLPEDNFCGECGRDLRDGETGPAIDYARARSYTPKFLVEKILTSRSALQGERKLVTVVFADVANYTSISEKLDPEEVHHIMDGCFRILMDEIHKYEGTINQFTGDGVMALFGAPVAYEDHAQRACHAALGIQRALQAYSEKIETECGVEFRMRIGLNSGPVIVGSIGDDLRMDYTAIGDTTNLASRMQSMATPGTVLVSRNTYLFVRDYFELQSLGMTRPKGREEPVEAFLLIRGGKAETRLDAAAVRGLTRFIGRQKEMGVFKDAFEKARSGAGQVVGIVGEAGVGKSRLKLELRKELQQEEHAYFEGRCPHYGRSMAYMPFLHILKTYFDIRDGEREFIIKKKMKNRIAQLDDGLRHVLSPFHEIFSLGVEDEMYGNLQPQQKRDRIFEAFRDLLIKESQNRPVVLAIEDMQWIDKTSKDFLDYFVGWLANARILLVLLYRPECTHPWVSKSYYRQLGVDQLSAGASAEMLRAVLGDHEVMPELEKMVTDKAGGNPLFVEELTRSLLENGAIERAEHRYELTWKAYEVPDTIQGIIAARIDRLQDHLKRILQVASVIGKDFAFSVLQFVTRLPNVDLKSHLLKLQELEFLYEKTLFPELEYTFKHALTREVAYRSLLTSRTKEIHQGIGKAIEALYSERLEEFYEMLAYHYARSTDSQKAYEYLKLAGIKQERRHSLWEAFRFFRVAINLLNEGPDTSDNKKKQIQIRLVMAPVMVALGYPEDSLEILQQGERFSLEVGDKKSLTTFYSRIGHYYTFKAGNPLPGIVHAENCFEEAVKIRDMESATHVACDLFPSYHAAAEFTKLVREARPVLSWLEGEHKESEWFGRGYNVYSVISAYYANSMAFLGDFEKAKTVGEKSLRVALADDCSLYGVGLVELLMGYSFAIQGDGKGAASHFQNSIAYCEEGRAVALMGTAWSGSGWAHYLLGDPGTGLVHVERGLSIQRQAGMPFLLSLHYCLLGMIRLELGELREATVAIEEALRLSQENHSAHVEGLSRALWGRMLVMADRSHTALSEKAIKKGIMILRRQRTRPFCALGYYHLGELYSSMGRTEKAKQNLKKAEEMFRGMDMPFWLGKAKAALAKTK